LIALILPTELATIKRKYKETYENFFKQTNSPYLRKENKIHTQQIAHVLSVGL